jgi:hypothetical protein
MVASPRREGPLDGPGDPFWGVPRPQAAAVVRAVSGYWRCPGAISADEDARTHLIYRATRKVGTMAGTATLNRSGRKNPLDQLTADHDRKYVAIELLEPLVGHQYAAERLPFSYINYDPRDDVVIVAVGGNSPRHPVVLRHMVWHRLRWTLPPKRYRNRRCESSSRTARPWWASSPSSRQSPEGPCCSGRPLRVLARLAASAPIDQVARSISEPR